MSDDIIYIMCSQIHTGVPKAAAALSSSSVCVCHRIIFYRDCGFAFCLPTNNRSIGRSQLDIHKAVLVFIRGDRVCYNVSISIQQYQ